MVTTATLKTKGSISFQFCVYKLDYCSVSHIRQFTVGQHICLRNSHNINNGVFAQQRGTCHLNNGRGSLGGSHAEHGPALIVDPVHVAAPEHEQVEDVEVAHAGRRKQGGLALLVEKWLKGPLYLKKIPLPAIKSESWH